MIAKHGELGQVGLHANRLAHKEKPYMNLGIDDSKYSDPQEP